MAYTDLYRADQTNAHFRKVLSNLVAGSSKRSPSVQMSHSAEGVYFANVYEGTYLRVKGSGKLAGAKLPSDVQQFLTTMVSFDYGASWGRIPASPPADGHCSELECGNLNLHLVGSGNVMAMYYTESAGCVMIAQGNIGRLLTYIDSELATYVSVDCGHSWKEVSKGNATIYEVADQGGVLVLAEAKVTSKSVKYSTDYGENWQSLKVIETDRAVMVGRDHYRSRISLWSRLTEDTLYC